MGASPVTPPSLLFQVRAESYACLTIDDFQVQNLEQVPGAVLNPPPAQRHPILMMDKASGQPGDKADTAWWRWFQQTYNVLNQTQPQTGLSFTAPSVDESDIDWFGNSTIDATTDPVTANVVLTGSSRFGLEVLITDPGTGIGSPPTFIVSSSNGDGQPATGTTTVSGGSLTSATVTVQGYGLSAPLVVTFSAGNAKATAALGRQWAIGDFIIWNDPTIVAAAFSYEIDQIVDIVATDATHAMFKLQRAASNAPAGGAQYGSLKNAHAGINFWRLINKVFVPDNITSAGPQPLRFLWDQMCVAAVTAWIGGQQNTTVNLAPLPYIPGGTTPDPRNTPPCPGLRTMNGAAYTNLGLQGNVAVNATAIARVPIQAWESIRTVYGFVRTAPVGATTFNGNVNAAIVIYVVYIDLAGNVGLVDTLVINTAQTNSYVTANEPDGRQMPYHPFWPTTSPGFDWPPNLLPTVTSGLDANGNLVVPLTFSSASAVLLKPDGFLDFAVAQVGITTAGANLIVTVQT